VLAPLAADRWFAAMLGIAALLPLLSATFAAARAIGDHAAARQALVVAVWVLASLGGAAWLERFVESYRGIEPGLAALTMVMVAAANVITVLALSRLMHSIADALDRAPVTTLPSAVLRPRAS